MRRYETIFILRPNASEDDITQIIDRNNGIVVDDFGGEMLKVDKWGLKKLAYLIKKEQQGYYVYIVYAGMPEAVDEMERHFKIDDRVLKYMTIKLQEKYTPDPEVEETEESEDTTEDAAEDAAEETKEAEEEVAAADPETNDE